MVEFERTEDRESAPISRMRICVAGVGGAGLNVLDRISLDRMMEATLVSMHTDVRVLGHAMTPVKIQLGTDRMKGIGSGGDPENGYEAAQESREQIKNALLGHDMVFVCCGLGGGTGCGAAPVVAEVAKEVGAMVFVFATMPFSFEGRRRITQAEVALDELGSVADALILFENNRMGELTLPKEGIQKAFSQADQLIGHSVRAISQMVMQPGIVRMGIADLLTALRGPNSRCLFGFGEARGTNRVTDALKRALKSPLINQGLLLQNARNLLVHVAGGESLTLAEVESLMKQLGKYVPEDTQIMFGLAVDAKLTDMISITLVSSLSVQEISMDSALAARAERPSRASGERPASPRSHVQTIAQPPAAAVEEPYYRQNGEHRAEAPARQSSPPVAETAPVAAPVPAPVPAPAAEFEAEEKGSELFALDTAPKAVPVSATQVSLKTSIFSESFQENEDEPEPSFENSEVSGVAAPAQAHKEAAEQEEEDVFVMPTRATKAPAPESAPSNGKASIFSVVDDGDDEDEAADDEDDDFVNEEDYSAEDAAEEESRTPQAGSHSFDDEDESEPAPPQATAPEPPARRQEGGKAAPAPAGAASSKATNDFKQSTFDLNPDDVGRFKGTDKTIVEGEDLDVPTWMRMRQKLKR